ncbi:hypothetical protein [Granulicella paludicola]|uniref:hypothetical protein n=1 Tax=Granulicella paludicola TaxID=474951 RepID=UPI0021E08509|nr:hypothetical protein [Granulicella paludicola]
MPTLDTERPVKRGSLRGRESRNQTLSTKLTETEYRTVENASAADGKTTGEWLRDLTLRSLRSGANDTELIALSEIVGVRLLLVNVLRSLGTGQRMTAEAFDKLVNEIGATKYDLATKLIAERRR